MSTATEQNTTLPLLARAFARRSNSGTRAVVSLCRQHHAASRALERLYDRFPEPSVPPGERVLQAQLLTLEAAIADRAALTMMAVRAKAGVLAALLDEHREGHEDLARSLAADVIGI